MYMWDPNSFEDRQVPPMSAEMFSALVTARVRPLEGIEVEGGKGLQLKLRVHGQDTTAQLDRYYDRYRANPDSLSKVIDEFAEALANGTNVERAGNAEFAAVADKLLPRLMTAQQWMKKRDLGLRIVVKSIAEDLGAALIVDEGNEIAYVEIAAIPVWDIESETAYQVARDNLERASSNISTTVSGERLETLLVDLSPHAAARVLLDSRIKDWQARVEGDLVLGVPTHDLLLGFSRQHPAFQELRAQVAVDARESPNGLLPNLLLVREGGLELHP